MMGGVTEQWTLDELVGRAAQALAAADVRAPNGRVTPLPDARVIRWYATIGLVDRPAGTRGRMALYGPRHLLQLVAVKRRQAQGRTLAEIQAELTGATDATLRRVAALPLQLSDEAGEEAVIRLPRTAHRDTGDGRTDAAPLPDGADRHRFWSQPVAEAESGAAESSGAGDSIAVLHGVRLAGATLLLPAPPDDDDLIAIRAAARPLLDLLAERGLLTPEGAPS